MGPSFIVIDTLARAMGAADENVAAEMGAFIQAADELKARFNASVLIVHHTGHQDKTRARGSSAFYAALDGSFLMKSTAGCLELQCDKAKDWEPPAPLNFRLVSQEVPCSATADADTTMVLEYIESKNPDRDRARQMYKEGMTPAEIMKKLKRNKSTVYSWLKGCTRVEEDFSPTPTP